MPGDAVIASDTSVLRDQTKVNFRIGSTIPRPEKHDAASRTVLDGDA
jgi:hypothetical protein